MVAMYVRVRVVSSVFDPPTTFIQLFFVQSCGMSELFTIVSTRALVFIFIVFIFKQSARQL